MKKPNYYSMCLGIVMLILNTCFSCTNTKEEEKSLLKKVTTRSTVGNKNFEYEFGNSKKYRDQTDINKISYIVGKGDVSEPRKLLKYPGININQKDEYGNTLLYNAVREGNLENIQELIQGGADVNQKDKYGNTPFMLAVQNKHKRLYKILLPNTFFKSLEKEDEQCAICLENMP